MRPSALGDVWYYRCLLGLVLLLATSTAGADSGRAFVGALHTAARHARSLRGCALKRTLALPILGEMGSQAVDSGRGKRRSWFRRRLFLVEGFQARFVLTQLLWLGCLLTMVAGALFGPLVAALLGPTDRRTVDVASRFLMLHGAVWPILAAFFVAAVVLSILMTHRVAGPLYRFRRVFADVSRGVLTMRVRTREGDYLTLEAAELDAMVTALRTRIEGAKLSVARAQGELTLLLERQGGEYPEIVQAADAVAQAKAALDGFHTDLTCTTEFSRSSAIAARGAVTTPRADAQSAAKNGTEGYTLLELLIAVAIIGILAAMAVPAYSSALESARVMRAVGDITTIDREVRMHALVHGCLPSTLAAMGIGLENMRDPWGGEYVYGALSRPGRGGGGGGRGQNGGGCTACQGSCLGMGDARKDRRLVPINSDFDLFSKGPDGRSVAPLTARASEDDIVRGSDGSYVGLARLY